MPNLDYMITGMLLIAQTVAIQKFKFSDEMRIFNIRTSVAKIFLPCLQFSDNKFSKIQVDAVDKNGLVLPVSLWIKKLDRDGEPRCLVVMEPVERTVAMVKFDSNVSYGIDY